MASPPRTLAPALVAALLVSIAGCAAPGARDGPVTWRTWTESPAPGNDAAALGELVADSTSPGESNAAWTARWTRTPVSLAWTDTALDLVVKYQQNPLRASRALALVHVAMHDALVVAARSGVSGPSRAIAVHRAAGLTLAHLYPNETPGRLEALGIAGAAAVARHYAVGNEEFARAFNAGSGAAQAAIARALTDGSGRVWPVRLRPAQRPGMWRAAPPLNLYDPAEAFAGEWRTWVLKDGAEIQPPPPIPYDSPEYWREVEQVLAVTRALTPAQKKIADDWNLDQGSVTPPGVWNRKAREFALAKGLDDAQAIRLFATLNVAMAEAFIACWRAKFTWWTLRPVNAIRDKLDPAYLPYLFTPPFPSYVSGHSSVSGAAAGVLGAYFPDDAETFTQMAKEAAISRLYGGIHFQSDNDEGLRLGRRVAAAVVARALPTGDPQRAAGTTTR